MRCDSNPIRALPVSRIENTQNIAGFLLAHVDKGQDDEVFELDVAIGSRWPGPTTMPRERLVKVLPH
jgi:hypothetical protein